MKLLRSDLADKFELEIRISVYNKISEIFNLFLRNRVWRNTAMIVDKIAFYRIR